MVGEVMAIMCLHSDALLMTPTQWLRQCYDSAHESIDAIHNVEWSQQRQKVMAKIYEEILGLSYTLQQGIKALQDILAYYSANSPSRQSDIAAPHLFIPYPSNTVVAVRRDPPADDEWMLALVLTFNPITLQYLVEDYSEDDDESHATDTGHDQNTKSRRQFMVSPSRVKRITESDSLAIQQHQFQPGHSVLALYPSTTVLYKATVVEPPAPSSFGKYGATNYRVQFDNDYVDGVIPVRNIPARYVLDFQIDPSLILSGEDDEPSRPDLPPSRSGPASRSQSPRHE